METKKVLIETTPDIQRYNWGALGITPLWLIRNGFWLTSVLYFILAAYFWPGTYVISMLFFIKGNAWSWGNGNRWNNAEEFAESQYAWGFVGILLLTLQALAIVFWLVVNATSI